jgi:Bromodomain/Bromodomain extra-terminal - transcription regulation
MTDRQQRSRRASLVAAPSEPEPTPFVAVKPTREEERFTSKQRTFCKAVIKQILSDESSDNFKRPVVEMWEESDIPDYSTIIKHPMDLGTVQGKLDSRSYVDNRTGLFDPEQFSSDVRLVFENCLTYNGEGTDMAKIAAKFLHWFEKEMTSMPGATSQSGADDERQVGTEEHSIEPAALAQLQKKLAKLRANRAVLDAEIGKEDVERNIPMSDEDRIQLRDDIEKLPWDRCRGVVELLQVEVNAAIHAGTEEAPEFVDIDLDNVEPRVLRDVADFIYDSPTDTKRADALAKLAALDDEIAALDAALPASLRAPHSSKKRDRSRDRERDRRRRRR